MNVIETQASQLSRALNDTIHTATAGYLDLNLLGLYQTLIPLSPIPDLATLVAAECTYTGYAAGAITWQLPSVNDDNIVEVVGTVPMFRPTNGVTPNQAYGVFITNAGVTQLNFVGQFDNPPLPMVSALDQILLTVRYRPATGSIVVVVS